MLAEQTLALRSGTLCLRTPTLSVLACLLASVCEPQSAEQDLEGRQHGMHLPSTPNHCTLKPLCPYTPTAYAPLEPQSAEQDLEDRQACTVFEMTGCDRTGLLADIVLLLKASGGCWAALKGRRGCVERQRACWKAVGQGNAHRRSAHLQPRIPPHSAPCTAAPSSLRSPYRTAAARCSLPRCGRTATEWRSSYRWWRRSSPSAI